LRLDARAGQFLEERQSLDVVAVGMAGEENFDVMPPL